DEYDITLPRAEVHRRIEEHFREVSASLPYFKRVKVLNFTMDELPRTATRKVKRREVVAMMRSMEENQKSRTIGETQSVDADASWIIGLVSNVANRPLDEISINSRLSDLGFDSLMFVELATAIENAGASISAPEKFNEIQDIRELMTVINRRPGSTVREARARETRKTDDEIRIPSLVKMAGNKAADALQSLFYEQFLNTNYE